MIECRFCREEYRLPPEKIGARCPTCRMPLFERDRPKGPPIDLGPCALHKDKSAHGKCHRCGKLICAVCRTRWEEEAVCPACLDRALDKEPNPQLVKSQERQAALSITLAGAGWLLLFLSFWPLRLATLPTATPNNATAFFILFLISLAPALCAAGQGAACVRWRGRRLAMAVSGIAIAGAQLGLMIAFVLVNVWLY